MKREVTRDCEKAGVLGPSLLLRNGRRCLYPIARQYAHRVRHRGINLMLRLLHPISPEYGFVRTVPFLEGLRLKVDTSSYLGWWMYFYGLYRPECLAITAACLSQGETVIDVGASIGVFTVAMAVAVGPRGIVLAFDPWPPEYERCAENLRLNGLTNVNLNREAVADATHISVIYGSEGSNQSNGSLEVGSNGSLEVGRSSSDSITSRICSTISIDDYMPNLNRLDFVKIDSQGADLKVLEGARTALQRWHPVLLLNSVHEGLYQRFGYCTADVRDLLRQQGYDIRRVDAAGRLSDADFSGRLPSQHWLAFGPDADFRHGILRNRLVGSSR
jgi:FkbM family methyltransferase